MSSTWFPPLPGDQSNETGNIPIGQTEDETPEEEEVSSDFSTENPKPRCQFGRPHVWMIGFYHEGQWVEGYVKCATCGQIEEDR